MTKIKIGKIRKSSWRLAIGYTQVTHSALCFSPFTCHLFIISTGVAACVIVAPPMHSSPHIQEVKLFSCHSNCIWLLLASRQIRDCLLFRDNSPILLSIWQIDWDVYSLFWACWPKFGNPISVSPSLSVLGTSLLFRKQLFRIYGSNLCLSYHTHIDILTDCDQVS